MTFTVFEMGTEDYVRRAFDVLRDGGVVIEAIHELPWSKCCATVIDKYGGELLSSGQNIFLHIKERNSFRFIGTETGGTIQ